MSKELQPLDALERHRKSIDDLLDNGSILPELHYVFMQELNLIETELKEYEGSKAHIEALNKERIYKDYVLTIIKDLLDIKIDLRDETQESIVQSKGVCQTISYEKAKLLKRFFG